MTVLLDPERREIATFFAIAGDLTYKRILEVGAGDGRLTWLVAERADLVDAIEPNPDRFGRATQDLPAHLQGRVRLFNDNLEEFYLADQTTGAYDLGILSWSL